MKTKKTPEREEIARLFLYEKPVGILLSLKQGKKYASIISKEVDCTYTHTLKILSKIKDHGLVKFTKKGRIKEVLLTDAGEDIARGLEDLVIRLKRLEETGKKKEKNKDKK